MNWSDTSLSGLLWHQVEVELLIAIVVLDKLRVDDASWLRVVGLTISASNEHSLVDSLVHDNKSDWRWATDLVVEWSESFLELSDLLLNDLVSHLSTNSISVDQDLGWLFTFVVQLKAFNGFNQASVEVFFDKLLVLGLDDDVRVISGLVGICGGNKSNDTLLTCVTNIDTDDHDLFLDHKLWPFHSQGLSSKLGVDLLHDIGGN
jgi:hypothetical protein